MNYNSAGSKYQSNATFSNLQVYNVALTAEQVQSLYTNPVVVVPEPAAVPLAGIGISAAAWALRRRRGPRR